MSVLIAGNSGVIADVDEARNILAYQGIPGYPTAGGYYSATGFTSAAVAAALAANTALMSARMSASSARRAYITKLRVCFTVITPGANGGVPGVLGFQRFTAATPTGGTARTVDRSGIGKGSATDITDIRDNNAALTVTSVTFGNLICASLIPTFPELTSGAVNGAFEWIAEFPHPIELAQGDGVCLRTQVACPATTTWGYSYNMYWFER